MPTQPNELADLCESAGYRMSGTIKARGGTRDIEMTPEPQDYATYLEAIDELREWAAAGFDPITCQITEVSITIALRANGGEHGR